MKTLQGLRKKINRLDKEIVKKISERFRIASRLGDIKKEKRMPIYSKEREKALQEMHAKFASEYSLRPDIVSQIFRLIMRESRKIQKRK